jgi:hypothetical protein
MHILVSTWAGNLKGKPYRTPGSYRPERMSQLARVPLFFIFVFASQIFAAQNSYPFSDSVGNPLNINPSMTLIGAAILAVFTVVCFIVSCCVASGKQQDNPELID